MKLKCCGIEKKSFILEMVKGKSILHIGCCDSPIFDPNNNLHIKLQSVCDVVDGVDVNENDLKILKEYCPKSDLYSNTNQITKFYDFLLLPDVIEHVDNIKEFFQSLKQLKFSTSLITVPNLIGHWQKGFFTYQSVDGQCSGEIESSEDYFEIVHPDHRVCFSPYTIYNCVELYTDWKILEIGMIDAKHTTYLICEN
jgi:hypothetical protein